MRFLFYIAALLCMIFVSGCASHEKEIANDDGPLLPMPEEVAVIDPTDAKFMNAVTEYFTAKNAPENSRYEFTRIDLNRDGRREGIVLMKAPHQYWCGFNGCGMAIFEANNDHFRLVAEVAPVRGPLTVSDRMTNGWKDIIVHVSGRMYGDTKDVALQFDGAAYPPQPAFQPPVDYAFNTIGGVRIFP